MGAFQSLELETGLEAEFWSWQRSQDSASRSLEYSCAREFGAAVISDLRLL